jgi:hypothetical protein
VRVGAAEEESVTVTVGVALVKMTPPTDDPYTVTLVVFVVVEMSMRTLEIGDEEDGEELLTNLVLESNKGVAGHAAAAHLNTLVFVVENTISKRSDVAGVEEELLKMMVEVALALAESSWIRAYTVCTTFAGDDGAAPPRANGMN